MRSVFKSVSLVVLLGVVAVALAGAGFMYSLLKGLPEVSQLKEFRHPHATVVYSDEGKKIGEFTTERRYPVTFETIPKHVIQAFLAAEDSNFYTHGGIEYTSIARAVLSNLLRGRYAQGGSTITQQVARALLLASKKKEITRKLREIVLSWRMEKELSKNEILNLYLNEIYLGHGAYGIAAAAENYYNKKVQDLTLAEAALLAGLPQRPFEWNPFHSAKAAKGRQEYVLKRMVAEKFIDQAQATAAASETLRLFVLEDLNNSVAPYFTEYVRQHLMAKYGSEAILTQGFQVFTTVKFDLQEHAEKQLLKGLREVDKRLGWRGVQKSVEPTKEKIEETQQEMHERVFGKLTRVRVLSPIPDASGRMLTFDTKVIEDKLDRFFGPTPVESGEFYSMLVTEVNDDKSDARGYIGLTPAILPLATLGWVNGADGKPVKKMSQVLKAGAIIDVKIERIERKDGVVYVALEQFPEVEGALLSFDMQSGYVQAMVGGTDFERSKFNIAIQAKRQVGSTCKPVFYAAAMDKGFSPASLVTDSPIVFKYEGAPDADNAGEDWRPHNYGGTFEGEIPLRLALIRSMNIPTVKLLNEITVDFGIQYARRLGITTKLQHDLSIALGSWSSSLEELTRAYAIFPRLGKPIQLTYIKKVVDFEGKVLDEADTVAVTPTPVAELAAAGKPLPTPEPAAPVDNVPPGHAISPQTAYVMVDMMKAVVREGTGRPAFLPGIAIGGKTGTSQDHRDAWFIGFTPQIMTGVWLGYAKDNKPLTPGETGGKAAAPIWAEYMAQVVKDATKNDFPIPDDIIFATIDRTTGHLAGAGTPNRVRVAFKPSMVPDRTAENLPRVGEPGTTRVSAAAPDPLTGAPGTVAPVPGTEEPAKDTSTEDFLRQGYQ